MNDVNKQLVEALKIARSALLDAQWKVGAASKEFHDVIHAIHVSHAAIAAAEKAQVKCKFCNGTGDIYSMSNQWLNACHNCEAGKKKQVGYLPERHAEDRTVNVRQIIQDGYALVPVDPSSEMIYAGAEGDSQFFGHAEFVYRRMLAAAQKGDK